MIVKGGIMAYKKPTYNKVMGPDLHGMEFIAADFSISAIIVIGVIGIVAVAVSGGCSCS